MSREIKFRAWNLKTKTMIDLQQITPLALSNPELEGIFIPFYENIILMQYTGLLDKNGKVIYEGDIVKYQEDEDDEEIDVGFIEWFEDSASFCINWPQVGLQQICEVDIEIIGNIHENPELLT